MLNDQREYQDNSVGPLITIAIPTFNRAELLKVCVVTALAQTYQDFELLVSDNASTDETGKVLGEFADRRLRVIRQKENVGLLGNWNACLNEARGKYVVLLSDDDRIDPRFLERSVAFIERERDLPIVVGLTQRHSVSDGHILPASGSQKFETGIWDGADILLELLRGRITVQLCTVLLRADMLRSKGGFLADFCYAPDYAAMATLLLEGKAGFVNECCGTYTFHHNSQTSAFSVDVLLKDVEKLAELISSIADRAVADPGKREQIKSSARRYLSLNVAFLLIEARKAGMSVSELGSVLWRWRRQIPAAAAIYSLRMTKLFAIRLLPAPAIRGVRRLLEPVNSH